MLYACCLKRQDGMCYCCTIDVIGEDLFNKGSVGSMGCKSGMAGWVVRLVKLARMARVVRIVRVVRVVKLVDAVPVELTFLRRQAK